MPIKYNTEIFIELSRKIHKNKYDYTLAKYANNHTNITIICPIHGSFMQQPQVHLNGSGCPKCGKINAAKKMQLGKENFIHLSLKKHKNIYDYGLVNYINNNTKVKIICSLHGIFQQTPRSHYYNGSGCPLCDISHKSNTREFIKKANKIYNNYYDYSNVKYVTAIKKVAIMCPSHGQFLTTPNNHLRGKGCPKCKQSKGEQLIEKYLNEHNIKYIPQCSFPDCKNTRPLKFDFYLPNKNICIEFDGEQHFRKFRFEKTNNGLSLRKKLDCIKANYCKTKNIILLRIPYNMPESDIKIKLQSFF
jgi:hypothetical protein